MYFSKHETIWALPHAGASWFSKLSAEPWKPFPPSSSPSLPLPPTSYVNPFSSWCPRSNAVAVCHCSLCSMPSLFPNYPSNLKQRERHESDSGHLECITWTDLQCITWSAKWLGPFQGAQMDFKVWPHISGTADRL